MNKKGVVYFDFLNVAACLCVIGMHCNGIVHRFENVPAWYLSLGIEVLGYWAVPGFFMLSGATMMNYRTRYSTGEFMKRRLLKVGIPMAVWTAVFYVWKLHIGAITWSGGRSFLSMLINFGVENVYWFFAPLLMIYLSMPVLSRLSDDRNLMRYILVVGVLTISVLPLLCEILGITYNSHLYLPVLGGYLLYPVLGYYLHTTELKPWQKALLYALGVLAVIVRYFHTAGTLWTSGTASQITWGYKNLPALLSAAAIFVLAKDICKLPFFQKETVQKLLRKLAGASFGIYLIHVFVMEQVKSLLSVDVYSPAWLWLGALGIYGICLTIVRLLQRTPVGKYVFP